MEEYLTENLDRYLAILKDMVAINSWTENRDGIEDLSHYTEGLFAKLGFTAERYPARYGPGLHLLLSRRGKGKKSLALISHLDTVYPPAEEKESNFLFEHHEDRIYGPGTNDIKGGTLCIYMLLELLASFEKDLYDETSWYLLFDATEETRSDDFGGLCRQVLPGDTAGCLVFEAGDFSHESFKLVTARKGRGVFRLTAHGSGGHAGTAHESGAGAIDLLARALTEIHGFTDYSRGLTFNVGTVSGGSGLNRIAEEAAAVVEMRCFDPGAFDRGRDMILSLAETCILASGDGKSKARLEVEEVRSVPAWPENEKTDRLFQVFSHAAESLGYATEKEKRGGLSDGNWICDRLPVLDGLGPAGEYAHCSGAGSREREYLLVSSLVPKTMLNAVAVKELLKG